MPIKFLKQRVSKSYGNVKRAAGFEHAELDVSFWKNLKKLVVLGILGGIVMSVIFVVWISKDLPDPNRLSERQSPESTKIYDRTGEHLLYEVYQSQKRTLIELDQMSPWILKSVIAIEDKKFYEHSGVRILSIARAAANNLLGRKVGSGGASTLTQQLIKNTVIGDEHSLYRKIKEAILALRLEKKYSKDDILKMYLNEIPLGSTNYGVESASQSYFHKKAIELDVAESATLAALIQAPTRYLNNSDALRGRRDLVIKLMFDQGMITEEQKNTAQNAELKIFKNSSLMIAPHFVMYVKQMLADQYGEKTVDSGGLKVITTIDYDKQIAAEKIVKENGEKFAKEANANNAALVAIDPKTGQILSMVGSRDFSDEEIDGQFNVAVLGKRQPGSSLKPFIYTLGFEKGYTPNTVLYDVSTNFDMRSGGNYTPVNYDGKERGLVTVRKALQGSLNIPAVKMLYLVGVEETIEFAKKFGYTTLDKDAGLSLVLGGSEVNLLEHTNAYAAIANIGTYKPPVSILKVSDKSGETMMEWKDSDGKEATTPELATTITNILIDDAARAYIFGAGGSLTLPGRPVAAKTGTTNNYKDAWTMGYTPSIATGVWVGNTKPSPMKGGGVKLAGIIWNQFMREATKDTPVENFDSPPANDATKPVLNGSDGGIKIKINSLNGKIATENTPPGLVVEKTYLPPHDILHYVSREDPRGSAPASPQDDPQYESWEIALQNWAERQTASGNVVSFEEPPTERDTTNSSPDLAPTVKILSPASGETISGRQVDMRVEASAPRGVKKVYYIIDGKQVGESSEFPFAFSYTIDKLYSQQHVLKIMAMDETGNAGVAESVFFINDPLDPPNVIWKDGNIIELTKEDFPRVVKLAPIRWDSANTLKIQLISETKTKNIYSFNTKEDQLNEQGTLEFTWKTFPGPGSYTLKAIIADKSGHTEESNLVVNIK